jgi:hypothetical protein
MFTVVKGSVRARGSRFLVYGAMSRRYVNALTSQIPH